MKKTAQIKVEAVKKTIKEYSDDLNKMLGYCGVSSVEELNKANIPQSQQFRIDDIMSMDTSIKKLKALIA